MVTNVRITMETSCLGVYMYVKIHGLSVYYASISCSVKFNTADTWIGLKGQYRHDNRAWNRIASFRLTHLSINWFIDKLIYR